MTKTGGNSNRKISLIFFGALVIAAYFVGLGALPFVGPDEPRYAQVAREMFERADFVTTTLGGFHWFEKPAFPYWLMMAGYKIFGVNEFAARAGSALCGLLTILTLYLLTKSVAAQQNSPDEAQSAKDKGQRTTDYFAFWTLLVSAASVGLIVFSHAATFDIALTFPVTAALACFFAGEVLHPERAGKNARFLFGFYFFTGVALLAKGLIGAVLPFGIVFWYFVAALKLPSKQFVLSLLWGWLVTGAVAAIWYLPVYNRHGWEFVDEFIVQQHFARYVSNKYQHPEPFWFFWAVLPGLTLPWTPFLLAAIWRTLRGSSFKFQISSAGESAFRDLRIFAFVWLLVPTVFFSFSGSKLPGYVLPALPGALVLIAEQVWLIARRSRVAAWILGTIAVLTLLAAPIALLSVAPEWARSDTAKSLIAAAAQNYSQTKIVNLHEGSHSLEFYAAGRLARDAEGRQLKFEGVSEIVEYMRATGAETVLVFVPLEYEHQLYENDSIAAGRIGDNTIFALVAVTEKQIAKPVAKPPRKVRKSPGSNRQR